MASAAQKPTLDNYFLDEKQLGIQRRVTIDNDTSESSINKDVIDDCLIDAHIKNNFKEVTLIGDGGFGHVYSATHRHEGKCYALKFVPFNIDNFDKSKREVQVLSSLHNENIIRYVTSWIIKPPKAISSEEESSDSSGMTFKSKLGDGCLIIQTEYCKTGTLKSLIDNEFIFMFINKDKRIKMILEIIAGLQYVHNEAYIHRDLKPQNIFIDQNYHAKIGDFGLARSYTVVANGADDGRSPISKKTVICLSTKLGTIPYMAPEVNSKHYDKRADFYSLGVIIFELFHRMSSGTDRGIILGKLRDQNFDDLGVIFEHNLPVQEIVTSLLRHEPSLRMELSRVISLLVPLLGHHRTVEKASVSSFQ